MEISPAAQADLLEIAGHIADDNPQRAHAFLDELEAACVGLGAHPEMGVARPDLVDGIRSLTHGSYLLFYRILDEKVRVDRVLHGARDLPAIVERSDPLDS